MIDCYDDNIELGFYGEKVKFKISDAAKYPEEGHSMNFIDAVNPLVEAIIEASQDPLEIVLTKSLTSPDSQEITGQARDHSQILEIVVDLERGQTPTGGMQIKPLHHANHTNFPSAIQPPDLELKPLLDHLKYAYLGDAEKLPVIISAKLTEPEEEKLMVILKDNEEAIGWTMADIKGIPDTFCTHSIHVDPDHKPIRQPQRRLNPLIMEVVKKEVIKLLDAGIIYAISDSPWVSPVQVVPKKTEITVIEGDDGIQRPTRVQNGWRVCIDYRRLNLATRKDHFPLPFIDQIIERLTGKSHYYFLDG